MNWKHRSQRHRAGGELGLRIDVTVKNNLFAVDVDADFIKPFQERSQTDGFIGLGMYIDGLARLAFTRATRTPSRGRTRRRAALATQEDDGYIGLMKPERARCCGMYEMAYIVLGLTSDYALFGNEEFLAAGNAWLITS